MEPTQPKPIANWNTARDVWETPQTEGLFCEHLDVYSETFPTSGMTANGVAYALPTWEPHTDGSGSSSLLRTVMADEAGGGPLSPAMAKHRGQTLRLSGQVIDLMNPGQLAQPLLQTPSVADGLGGHERRGGKRANELLLNGQVKQIASRSLGVGMLLPTPVAQPSGNSPADHLRKKPGRQIVTDLAIIVENDLILSGGRTNPPSGAGNQLWEDVPLPLLNPRDETADTGSAPGSPNG